MARKNINKSFLLFAVLVIALCFTGAVTADVKKIQLTTEKNIEIRPQRFGFLSRLFGSKSNEDCDNDDFDNDYDDDDDDDDDDDNDDDDDDDKGDYKAEVDLGNGNYDENDDDHDGLWHTPGLKPHQKHQQEKNHHSSFYGREPFPRWLADLTGRSQWPGKYPPYIPMSNIDLSNLPEVPRRFLGNCTDILPEHCSFDCFHCTTPDDVFTCPLLSQTFDDGPGPATPKLLKHLPGKTTFFTQGINVVRFPEIFRLQHAKGHLLATHTWSHAHLAELSDEDVVAQIQWSIWAMNATAGIIPKFFRPPYGASDARIRAITRQFGLINVFWDRDTLDWMVVDGDKTPEEVYDDVRQWKRELPQGLILEHDSTIEVVNVGINVAEILNSDRQMTVADCINSPWYQESFY